MDKSEFISREEAFKCVNEKGKKIIGDLRKRKSSEEEIAMVGYAIVEAVSSLSECKVYRKAKKEQTS